MPATVRTDLRMSGMVPMGVTMLMSTASPVKAGLAAAVGMVTVWVVPPLLVCTRRARLSSAEDSTR